MGNNLKYIVYQTTNKVNNKIYIGVHGTETPDVFDNYLGNGFIIGRTNYLLNNPIEPFHYALKKYGISSFYRTTLKVFDTKEEALKFEAEIVNEEFVKRSDTYNITVGGGMPPLLTKTVYQFNIKGDFIKEWKSETEINKYYNCSVNFSDIIKNKRSFAGYFWNFEKEIDITEYKTETSRGFISVYNLNGILLNTFKNTTIAAQKLDLDSKAITQAVFKKKKYNGYYFLKADVDIAEVLSKKFKKSLGKRFIYCYNEDGSYHSKYETCTAACKELNFPKGTKLKRAVVNGCLCKGYRWSYSKSDNYFNIENPKEEISIKIGLYDKEGNLIKIWENPSDCKKEYKYCLRVCRGDLKSTQGFIFKYI